MLTCNEVKSNYQNFTLFEFLSERSIKHQVFFPSVSGSSESVDENFSLLIISICESLILEGELVLAEIIRCYFECYSFVGTGGRPNRKFRTNERSIKAIIKSKELLMALFERNRDEHSELVIAFLKCLSIRKMVFTDALEFDYFPLETLENRFSPEISQATIGILYQIKALKAFSQNFGRESILHDLGLLEAQKGNVFHSILALEADVHIRPDQHCGSYDYIANMYKKFLGETAALGFIERVSCREQIYGTVNFVIEETKKSVANKSNFVKSQNAAIQRGVPAIFLSTLPKSGSMWIVQSLATRLNCPAAKIQLATYNVRPWIDNAARGGCLIHEHLFPDKKSLSSLISAGLRKLVVHVRDPREASVSWFNHLEKLNRQNSPELAWHQITKGYWQRSESQKLREIIDVQCSFSVDWISRWQKLRSEVASEMEVKFSLYDDLVLNDDLFLDDLLEFFSAREKCLYFTKVEKTDKTHFRKGELGEWKNLISPDQRERLWKKIPKNMSEEFGWSY